MGNLKVCFRYSIRLSKCMFMHITINCNILNVKWRQKYMQYIKTYYKTYISSLTAFLHNWVEYILVLNEIRVKKIPGWMYQRGMHNGRVK